jgi:hypothetical protein
MQRAFPPPTQTRLTPSHPLLHRQGETATSSEAPTLDPESLLVDKILLPTARLSRDIITDLETRPPQDAHSQEEAVVLSYVENRQKYRVLSILDGAFMGLFTGVVAGLASIPIALGLAKTNLLTHYPNTLEKGKVFEFVINHLLFQGFEEIAKAENTLKSKLLSILPSVLKTTAFGVLSGAFLSMHLTKHQVKSAKHIANEWHKSSERLENPSQKSQTSAQNSHASQAPSSDSSEPTLTYAQWKHYAEDWKHHAVEAFRFNFLISTAVLGVQITALAAALWLAKREELVIKKYFDALATHLKNPRSPLHFINSWEVGVVDWIKAKSDLPNSKAIHESFQHEWPTQALTWLTGRFSILNVARLSMLSILMAKLWADKNTTHIKDLETDVSHSQRQKPKTI